MPVNEELLEYRIYCIVDSYAEYLNTPDSMQACTDAIMFEVLEAFGVIDEP